MGRSYSQPSLAKIIIGRVVLMKGGRVLAFILAWSVAEEALGYPPTLEEYAEWWNESRATAFREQARFRECFPDEATPQRIVDLLKQQRAEWRQGGVQGLGRVQLAGL